MIRIEWSTQVENFQLDSSVMLRGADNGMSDIPSKGGHSMSGDGQRGGKTDQMRQLAGRFRTDSGQIQTLIRSLDSDTTNSQPIWQGPAADRFRGDWSSFKPTMDKLVHALDEAAQAIDKNAQAIDAATS
jgi:WXG100 family type VII secretion target